MKMRCRLLLAAAGIGLAIGSASAWADNTPSSESMTDPEIGPPQDQPAAAIYTHDTIEVEADNLDWSHAKPAQLSVPFHVEAKTTKNKWDLSESYVIVGLAPIISGGVVGSCCGQMEPEDFSEHNHARLIAPAAGNSHMDKDVFWTLDVTAAHMGTRARNACRDLRKTLEQQGLDKAAIFGQDRDTTIATQFRYVASVSYNKATGAQQFFWKQSQPSWRNINVVCKKRDESKISVNPAVTPGASNLAAAFKVNQAALAITPKHYAAKCPAKLHLNPTIEATGKGTVKYRFVDQLGHHSQTFQVKFDKSDVKFLDHVIEIDGKGKPKGLGFAAAQPQGGALGLVAPNDPNLTQGYFQLEVLSPHKKLSNIADYSVKCSVKTGGNDAITSVPDTVNPAVVGELTVGLPDLVIDSVQPSPAVPTKLFVKITNQGKSASKPTNLKAIRWVGSEATGRGTLVPAIGPGQSQVVLAELGGTIDGATQLYVRVDDPNRIPESNDGNNSFKVK
jgi:hypothetical protein